MSSIRVCQYFRKTIICNLSNQIKYNIIKSCNEKTFCSQSVLFKYTQYNPQSKSQVSQAKSTLTKQNKSNSTAISEETSSMLQQNDPDLFGSLSTSTSFAAEVEDDGDLKEEEYISSPPNRSQKLSTKQYAEIIKDHLKNKRIKEAIDVLEQKMIKEDRVKPENYIYNLLIGGCARSGYTKKAFQLYNKMKQRDLKVTGGTYTALFNACATTPWIESMDGLNKANNLRVLMIEKGYEPNSSNYNAMIKAYGRCGDIKIAFQLVDEMKSKEMEIGVDTFNFLLQACASDKNYGFRHALVIWHKMLSRKLVPDIYTFNLLLRCTRDCEIGDLDTMTEVIQQILEQSKKLEENNRIGNLKYVVEETKNDLKIISFKQNEATEVLAEGEDAIPNLISKKPHLGSLIALGEVTKPEDRLLLLGGISGFLKEMELSKVTPDIKTFTELLEIIPGTHSAEKKIIASIRKIGIKADIDFFNILIKKRSMRFDYESAKEVLSMVRTAKLQPDIVTYGVLALGCQTQEEAMDLIEQMKEQNIRINIQILGAMLKQGCYKHNFNYIKNILNIMNNEGIKPNGKFISHLDNFRKYGQSLIKQNHPNANAKKFREQFSKFKLLHDNLLDEAGLKGLSLEDSIKKLKIHPYEQFKTSQPVGFEMIKGEKIRHEKKLRRYIKRINPDKLSDGNNEKKEIID